MNTCKVCIQQRSKAGVGLQILRIFKITLNLISCNYWSISYCCSGNFKLFKMINTDSMISWRNILTIPF